MFETSRSQIIKIRDNLAYVSNSFDGMLILELSDPVAPVQHSTVETQWAGNFSIAGDSLYLAEWRYGAKLLDISDPESIQVTGSCNAGASSWDVYKKGAYMFVTDRVSCLNVLNISNPAEPELEHMLEVANSTAVHGSGDFVYAIADGNLTTVDMTNPAAPTVSTWYQGDLSTVFASGRYVYAGSPGILRILDMSEPTAPVQVGELSGLPGSRSQGLNITGSFAYLANRDGGMHIVNIADPTNPQLVGTHSAIDNAWDVFVAGKYAYVADRYSGLAVIDISDPEAPYEVGYFWLDSGVRAVSGSGRYAYIMDPDFGLRILDCGNPFDPIEVGYHETGGRAWSLYSEEGNIYATDDDAGSYIFQTDYSQKVLTVNSMEDNSDANPGDGVCDNGTGHCTLRAAIEEANAYPGYDRIEFAIPGPGIRTIQPSYQLPWITEPLVMDATSQPGDTDTPLIQLDGIDAGPYDGLVFSDGYSTLKGLSIIHCGLEVDGQVGWGVKLQGGAANIIQACHVGLDDSGTEAYENTIGVYVENSKYNLIGGLEESDRNLISGNLWTGIDISAPSEGGKNSILGNYIGTDITGTMALGNDGGVNLFTGGNFIGGPAPGAGNVISGNIGSGIALSLDGETGEPNLVRGNMIGTCACGTAALPNGGGIFIDSHFNILGGTEPGAGNLISGNFGDGVFIFGNNNHVIGNLIGLDKYGIAPIGNENTGVMIGGPNNVVGGTAPGAGNVISANNVNAIQLTEGAHNNVVSGNFLGTDYTGTQVLGNGYYGVRISSGASNNLIGGTIAGAGNVVSGNYRGGLSIGWYGGAFGNLVQGNLIGTDISGTQDLGNGRTGISMFGAAVDNQIGGRDAGAGNVIAYSEFAGVSVNSTSIEIRNSISGNSIFGNGEIGIDLSINASFPYTDGFTENDAGDADNGPNHLQNFPESINIGIDDSENLLIQYSIDSEPGNSEYPLDVEFFVSDEGGEGQLFFAFDEYTSADYEAGLKTIILGPAINFDLELGDQIVATATDALGNTSEFSEMSALGDYVFVGDQIEIPDTYVLEQNFPNPFNPLTTIRYGLPEISDVNLMIYDVKGRVVHSYVELAHPAGWVTLEWDGTDASGNMPSTGVYFCRMISGDYSRTIKMVYLR